ncbi:hypothetical protein ACIOJE_14960 [Kitasatospora sp. NPDC087861]
MDLGIDIALYDGPPDAGRRPGPTLLHLSGDHGPALAATPGSRRRLLGD